MVSSSENSKSPFRGLECLRPIERGERCVAVATYPLQERADPAVVQVDTQSVFGTSTAQRPHSRILRITLRIKSDI